MMRTLGARLAKTLMLAGVKLSVATAPPPEWPLDHTTDECMRCRDHLVVSEEQLHAALCLAGDGLPVGDILVNIRSAARNVEMLAFWDLMAEGA